MRKVMRHKILMGVMAGFFVLCLAAPHALANRGRGMATAHDKSGGRVATKALDAGSQAEDHRRDGDHRPNDVPSGSIDAASPISGAARELPAEGEGRARGENTAAAARALAG